MGIDDFSQKIKKEKMVSIQNLPFASGHLIAEWHK